MKTRTAKANAEAQAQHRVGLVARLKRLESALDDLTCAVHAVLAERQAEQPKDVGK